MVPRMQYFLDESLRRFSGKKCTNPLLTDGSAGGGGGNDNCVLVLKSKLRMKI